MEILAALLVLLLLTRAFGEGAERLGQPAAVGELLAGVVLAAVIALGLDGTFLRDWLGETEALGFIAEIGMFFLALSAGVEMRPEEITSRVGSAFAVAVGGAVLPLICGFLLAWTVLPEGEQKLAQAALVGVALSITAIPVTTRVFAELGLLHGTVGRMVVSAAIFDDIVGLFLLALLIGLGQGGEASDLAALGLIGLKVVVFFAITVGLGNHIYPRLRRRLRAMQIASLEFSILMSVALAYGLLAMVLGMHWILGAFLAGLFLEPRRVGAKAYNEMRLLVGGLTEGFLAPLFFVYIGLQVDLTALSAVPGFIAILIAVAFLGKLLGAGLPAWMFGLGARNSAAIGIGMSARGAVELVVLNVAVAGGILSTEKQGHVIIDNLFSSLVIVAVVTTLLTPVLLRALLRGQSEA